MALFNPADGIGILITYINNNITGSEFLTLFVIAFILLCIGFMFRMPLLLIMSLILPVILVCAAYTTAFIPVLIIVLLYIVFGIARKIPWG